MVNEETDSANFPVATAEEEAAFVHGADLGEYHPDNVQLDPAVNTEVVIPEPDPHAGEELPGEDDLAEVVADVDPDAVDSVGFDDADLGQLEREISDAGVTPGRGA